MLTQLDISNLATLHNISGMTKFPGWSHQRPLQAKCEVCIAAYQPRFLVLRSLCLRLISLHSKTIAL